ncbi:hypothetical protein EZV62_001138 [Acer yangbiense]|uniref:Uncharacterized protein n=1 Tax=Acer yangbiense TaxID=1000413 RepID=A0A5C7ITW8_9ROSI|nr:hypothetical protein EZV62_001138 [Acer yangbiense]
MYGGTEGYLIEFQMEWLDCRLLGFAVCIVIAFDEEYPFNIDYEDQLLVFYDCRFSDETLICEGYIRVASRNGTLIDSDHAAFWICKALVPKSEFTNCLFEFSLSDENPNCRVKYCTVHPIYAEILGNFEETSTRRSRTSNDHHEEVEPHPKRLNRDLFLLAHFV